jgi:hypothetical protein
MDWETLLRGQRGELKRLMKEEGIKGRYTRITLPLTTAQNSQELHINGDYMGVVSITGTGTCKVRLDHRHSQEIDLRELSEVISPFGKLYFTTDGAGGEANIYIGGALTARLKPVQAKVSIRSVAGSDVDLALDSTALLQAKDKRFTAHTGGHAVKQIVADTPIKLTAASKKVKWAIIHVDLATRWGFVAGLSRTTPVGALIPANGDLTVEYCDLTELYIVNDVAAEAPLAQIEYVEEA